MRIFSFSVRTFKEILRDPTTLIFGLGFPVVLLLLLSAIQANIPVSLFEIQSLSPGIVVFGLAFITLFTATLLAKDRESALLQRLYTTPLRAVDYILGYALPMLPIAFAQSAICYLLAMCLGLLPDINIVYALLMSLPISLFFIAVGLIFGSILKVKGASGVCGGLFTNLAAWLSGIWFDLSLVGGVFEGIAKLLPFFHAVELQRGVLNGEWSALPVHLYYVLGYTAVAIGAAIALFLRQMRKE